MKKIALSGAGGQLGSVVRTALVGARHPLAFGGGFEAPRAAGGRRGRDARRPARSRRRGSPAGGCRRADSLRRHERGASAARNHRQQPARAGRGVRRRAPARRSARGVCQLEPCDRHVSGHRASQSRLRAASGRFLRPEQGVGRSTGENVLGQARHREYLRAHRQLPRAADRAAAPEHLVRSSRPAAFPRPLCRGRGRRLHHRVGRVGQHT